MNNNPWYSLRHAEKIDSPALLVYPERVKSNIEKMIAIAGIPDKLMVHVKTHKMPEVVKLQLAYGIHRFKCATIAEAEMLASSGAKDILIAYQLNQTKICRLLKLIKAFPDVHFASLVDNTASAEMLHHSFEEAGKKARVFIDIDNGMHRTGRSVKKDIPRFYSYLSHLSHIKCMGLHVYDGHLNIHNFEERKRQTRLAFEPVEQIIAQIQASDHTTLEVIAGGSPTFPIHADNPKVLCSPGTGVFWDVGYAKLLPEQDFNPATVLLTRIISKPVPGSITTDLGHKSVAAENSIEKRISFLNLNGYEVISQSEEHLTIKTDIETWEKLAIGDVLYGVPYHICPSVALYDEAQAIVDGKIVGQWQITARKKKISI